MSDADTLPGPPRANGDASQRTMVDAPAALPPAGPTPSALDRVILLPSIQDHWLPLGWLVTVLAALVLRLMRLDSTALGVGEAAHAYDAWTVFRGQPGASGEEIPGTGAFLLLLEGMAFFLFGATDVVARIIPVLTGLAIVLLPLALRRWVGAPAALGMAALAAISPTMVYASRVASPEIVIAALALAAAAILVHLATRDAANSRRGAIALGVVAGAALATAPSSLTVTVTLLVGIALSAVSFPIGVIRRGLRAVRGELLVFLLALVITAALLFTRFLSYPAGIAGVAESFRGWWGLLAGGGEQPVQLFFLALLIYEPIAIVFAVVALIRDDHREAATFFGGWFAAAFAVWSFSAGRGPEHAIHVALPLVVLAGAALGSLLHRIDWHEVWHGRGGIIVLAMFGVVLGLAATGVLLARASTLGGGLTAALQPTLVFGLVVMPLLYLIWRVAGNAREEGSPGLARAMTLLVLAILLGAFGLRSATLLAFSRADLGTELLAQRTATLGTLPSIERFLRLARDVGVTEGSPRDPTGSHSLSIALEADVRWPYVWYFREFPGLTVVAPGDGPDSGSQVVIATADTGLADAGYALQTWPWQNTVPPGYFQPDMGSILGAVIDPRRWREVSGYLLFRDGIAEPPPVNVEIGLGPELARQVAVQTGPYDLGDLPVAGTEPGQFTDPIGIAVGPDGVIAVVDSGNGRVQRFSPDGEFRDVWGRDPGGVSFTRTDNGLGPTGITVSADGTTWIADTWGHRVVALDANGAVVQIIGGETVDTGDDATRVDEEGGRFFGPRAVAVSDDAIYVTDTGNERVQLFTRDGAFVDAWGGHGSGPDRLIEPVGIALGPDGNVYVADSGNARISVFTPTGEPVTQWPVPDWPAPDPSGIPPAFQPYLAFDTAGNLYATASNSGQALMLDAAGTIVARIADAGGERLTQPIGVAVAPDGTVFFTDVGRDAVLEYLSPDPLDAEDLDVEDAGASMGP